MGITDKLKAQIEALKDFQNNRNAYLARLLFERSEELLDRQRDQLASGLDSEGRELAPRYSEDLKPGGHFNSRSAAERYAAWKKTINVPVYYKQTERDTDVPNLYIDGTFYSQLAVDITEAQILFAGGTMYAADIIAKYGLDKFGLNEDTWREVMENGVIEELLVLIREKFDSV